MKEKFSWQISEKSSNIKFNENLSGGSWLLHVNRRMNGQTGTTKLLLNCHSSANAPNKYGQ